LARVFLPFDSKLLKPNRGEVAEWLNAAVCEIYLPCSYSPLFISFE